VNRSVAHAGAVTARTRFNDRMRIAQIVLPGASEYERKSQRADHGALSGQHEVVVVDPSSVADAKADVAHVYSTGPLPAPLFRRFPFPYVASSDLPHARVSFLGRFRPSVAPSFVFSPLADKGGNGRLQALPEAVEQRYWGVTERRSIDDDRELFVVGSFSREPLRNMVEQTVVRLHRFRSDIEWRVISHVPSPRDLAGVDVWVDPAIDENDFDGCVAEALVAGVPTVASRTPINERRLEKGRCGALVPTRDPNELTHAILTTLFKREVRESRAIAARQTASRFQARQRLRILLHAYETLVT
jgi:glycosyltransferase involved in cell wall biosynthesis